MPSLPQETVSVITDWVKALAPIFGPVGVLAGWILGRKQRKVDAEAAHSEREAAQIDAITRRFTALMDGYDHRIADLVARSEKVQAEADELRHQLRDNE